MEAVQLRVTPFLGVWIEIKCEYDYVTPRGVTPFLGVWIEIPTTKS